MNTLEKIREIRKHVDGDLYKFGRIYLQTPLSFEEMEQLIYGEPQLSDDELDQLLNNALDKVEEMKEGYLKIIDETYNKIDEIKDDYRNLNSISFIE